MDCPTAYYKDHTAQSACILCEGCEPGKRRTNCGAINGGSSSTLKDKGQCTECDAGKYKSIDGTSDCINCPAGKYSDGPGFVTCLECPMPINPDDEKCVDKTTFAAPASSHDGVQAEGDATGVHTCDRVSSSVRNSVRTLEALFPWTPAHLSP